MNNFEIIRVLNRMIDGTREISICSRVYFIKKSLIIDKNIH